MDTYLESYVDAVMAEQELTNGIFKTSLLAKLGQLFGRQ